MKGKIFRLGIIINSLTLLINFIGCENKNNEKVTNESNIIFQNEETNEKSDEKVNSKSESVSKEKEINNEKIKRNNVILCDDSNVCIYFLLML